MNKRIRELAEQAKCYADENNAHYLQNPHWIKTFEEKFAELIIKECAKVCEKQVAGAVGTYAGVHNNAVGACIKGIKEHFGVE